MSVLKTFEELLWIKKIREQAAANAVTRAKDAVEEAQLAVTEAENEVREYSAFRAVEELRLFEEIRGRGVKLDDIDEMKYKVSLLRVKEEELRKVVEDKKQAMADAEANLQQAEEDHIVAQKSHEKFEQFVEVKREEALKEATEREEAEVEEITEVIFAGRRTEVDA